MPSLKMANADDLAEKYNEYFTASQWQLVWWRFRRHRGAMIGGCVLLTLFITGIFAGFFAPYEGGTRDRDYILGAPQLVKFWDHNGFSIRPFVHDYKTKRDPATLQKNCNVRSGSTPLHDLFRARRWLHSVWDCQR